MAKKVKDFDQFLAEREDRTMVVRVFERDCEVPVELPWLYMLKIEGMIKKKISISGQDNMGLLSQMFAQEDFQFITTHPEFRASNVWELIAYTWLNIGNKDEQSAEPVFKTEDDVKVEDTKAGAPKK